MAYDASASGTFSGRPNHDLYVYVRRDQTDVANRRATYAFQVIARRLSGAVSYDLTGRTVYMSIGSHYQESYGNVLDFRNTSSIVVGGGTTGWITHDTNGYLNLNFSAVMENAGLFGTAGPAGTLVADRIPVRPNAPGTPSASSVTATSMALSWTAPANGGSAITNYYLDRATNSSFTQGLTTVTLGNTTSYTAAGLSPATTYYWRVSAKNGVGTSGESGTRTQATKPAAPSAPRELSADDLAPTSLNLGWLAPATNGGAEITNYTVQRALNSEFTLDAVTFSAGTALNRLMDNLNPSTRYYFRVSATNSAGTSPWSTTADAVTVSGVYYSNGSSWLPCGVFVSDGTNWVPAELSVSSGGVWVAAT